MGFAGIKIPGHSGTQQKHRKVYATAKKYHKTEKLHTYVKTEPREPKSKTPSYSIIKKVIAIKSLVVILFLILFLGNRIYNISLHRNQLSTAYLAEMASNEDKEAAIFLYKSAEKYYNAGILDEAQNEITQVLRIYPKSTKAIKLMSNILVRQCEEHNKFCQSSEDYLEYLDLISTKNLS